MAACSFPGCPEVGVLQWQRLAGPDEGGDMPRPTQEGQQFLVEMRRAQQRRAISELEALREFMAPDQLRNLDTQLQRERATLAAIADAPPLPEQPDRPTTIAVHGCEAHAVGLDAATQLHQPSCMTAGVCGCVE